jgi:hypothetical protein
VPALFHIHTVRLIDDATVERKQLNELFGQWAVACSPGTDAVRRIIVAVSGGATRAGLWGAAVLDQLLQRSRKAVRLSLRLVSCREDHSARRERLHCSVMRPCHVGQTDFDCCGRQRTRPYRWPATLCCCQVASRCCIRRTWLPGR